MSSGGPPRTRCLSSGGQGRKSVSSGGPPEECPRGVRCLSSGGQFVLGGSEMSSLDACGGFKNFRLRRCFLSCIQHCIWEKFSPAALFFVLPTTLYLKKSPAALHDFELTILCHLASSNQYYVMLIDHHGFSPTSIDLYCRNEITSNDQLKYSLDTTEEST